ncbi:MAG: hypothetical protein WC627_12220 [Legionella sp.]|jgi:hypothetical protein
MSLQYKVFQLNLSSELFFPELLPLSFDHDKTDVSVRLGAVSAEGIENPIRTAPSFQAKKNTFWLNIPEVARYLVLNGSEIIVDPADNADEILVRIFLLGSCFGALLMQRGFFVLHGNAIGIGPYAFSITGFSGAGKSTLAGSLAQRGYPILADDVCAINADAEIVPSFPQIKLWADAAKQLSIETDSLRKIRPDMNKFAVPLATDFCSKPLPLKLVYILNTNDEDVITHKNLTGFEKYIPLRTQTYRQYYVQGLAMELNHKIQCSSLAERITVVEITRPKGIHQIAKLTDYIEEDLKQRGLITCST